MQGLSALLKCKLSTIANCHHILRFSMNHFKSRGDTAQGSRELDGSAVILWSVNTAESLKGFGSYQEISE